MANLRSFYGNLYIAPVNDAGTLTGNWEFLGEAYPMSLQLSKEVTSFMGRTKATYNKQIGSKEKPSTATGSLRLNEYSAKHVAKALSALISTRAVSSSTLSAKAVTVGDYGEYVDIGTEDLSSVVVQDATDTTTYVLDTDYSLDAVLGLIAPIDGGSIAEDATLHISATGAANTDTRLTIGGAGTTQKYAIKGALVDEFEGTDVKLYLRKVLLTTNAEVILVSDEGAEKEALDFTLTPEIPTGQTDYGTLDGLPM